jgi:hypothetical protein
MERGHAVRQRAQRAQPWCFVQLVLVQVYSRFALRRTGCPRSINLSVPLRLNSSAI